MRFGATACALVPLAITPTSVDAVPVAGGPHLLGATAPGRPGRVAAAPHPGTVAGGAAAAVTTLGTAANGSRANRPERAGADPVAGASALFAAATVPISFVGSNESAPDPGGSDATLSGVVGPLPSATAPPGVEAGGSIRRDVAASATFQMLIGGDPFAQAMRSSAGAMVDGHQGSASEPPAGAAAPAPSPSEAAAASGRGSQSLAHSAPVGAGAGNKSLGAAVDPGDGGHTPTDRSAVRRSPSPDDPVIDPIATIPDQAPLPPRLLLPLDSTPAAGPAAGAAAADATVPEPSTLSLLLPGIFGIGGIGLLRLRKSRSRPSAARSG